jgi:hypothetical protein
MKWSLNKPINPTNEDFLISIKAEPLISSGTPGAQSRRDRVGKALL